MHVKQRDTCEQNIHTLKIIKNKRKIKRKWELRWVVMYAFNPIIR